MFRVGDGWRLERRLIGNLFDVIRNGSHDGRQKRRGWFRLIKRVVFLVDVGIGELRVEERTVRVFNRLIPCTPRRGWRQRVGVCFVADFRRDTGY